jgi:hypothetical protein
MSNEVSKKDYGAVLEKVIINNDLASLSSVEKVQHIKNVCDSIGLNALTKPIQLIKFQGKEVMYFTRDATDQLRKINNVSVSKLEKEFNGDIYIVTAYVEMADGRKDASTGAIMIKGLIGDALCNALMKCESKAKRRATLSICGLGFAMDESETDSIPNAVKSDPHLENAVFYEAVFDQFNKFVDELNACTSIEQLQLVFDDIKKFNFKSNPELLKRLVVRKDEIKMNILQEKALLDAEKISS